MFSLLIGTKPLQTQKQARLVGAIAIKAMEKNQGRIVLEVGRIWW